MTGKTRPQLDGMRLMGWLDPDDYDDSAMFIPIEHLRPAHDIPPEWLPVYTPIEHLLTAGVES